MAEANTSSTQQSADAQHVDNMTSMQQGGPEAPTGARSDAPIQTSNVGGQDGPSQLNGSPNGASNANSRQGGANTGGNITGSSGPNIGGGFGANADGRTGSGANSGNIPANAGQGGRGLAGTPNNAGVNGTTVVASSPASTTSTAPAAAPTTPTATSPTTTSPTTTPTTALNNVTLTGAGAAATPPIPANTTYNYSGEPTNKLPPPVLDTPIAAAITELNTTTVDGAHSIVHSLATVPGVATGDIVHLSYFDANTNPADSVSVTLHSVSVAGAGATTFAPGSNALAALTAALTPDPGGNGVVTQVFSLDKVSSAATSNNLGLAGIQTGVDLKFIASPNSFNALSPGQTITATYDVVVTNTSTGLSSTLQQAIFTIDGANHDLIPSFVAPVTQAVSPIYTDPNSYGNLDLNSNHANLVAYGVVSLNDVNNTAGPFQVGDSSGLASPVVAQTGDYGRLILGADGSYFYSIASVPGVSVDGNGAYLAPQDGGTLGSETWVVSDYQNQSSVFAPGTVHTDVFTIATADGTTANLSFSTYGDHNIGGYALESATSLIPSVVTGSLNFAAGTHDAIVIAGATPNQYTENIGTLSINDNGAYAYTVTSDQIQNYETTSGSFTSFRDSFVVESTLGTNVAIQEVSFNVYLPDTVSLATSSNTALANATGGPTVFLFPTWDAVTSSPHTIANFNNNGDTIDLSQILSSTSDTLRDVIYIDDSGIDTPQTSHSVLSASLDGGLTYHQVADVSSVTTQEFVPTGNVVDGTPQFATVALGGEFTIPDLMWSTGSSVSQSNALNAATSWTDIVSISHVDATPNILADHGASINAGSSYAGSGGWTIEIVSGSATVDGHNISFSTPNSQNDVIITDPHNVEHQLNNVSQINWHSGA